MSKHNTIVFGGWCNIHSSCRGILIATGISLIVEMVLRCMCVCHNRERICWWSWRMTTWTWSTHWDRLCFTLSLFAASVFGASAETTAGQWPPSWQDYTPFIYQTYFICFGEHTHQNCLLWQVFILYPIGNCTHILFIWHTGMNVFFKLIFTFFSWWKYVQ